MGGIATWPHLILPLRTLEARMQCPSQNGFCMFLSSDERPVLPVLDQAVPQGDPAGPLMAS